MSIPGHSEFVSQLIHRIRGEFLTLTRENAKVVVAVSGGPDSVALLSLLYLSQSIESVVDNLVIAHCNHNTRPDSKCDEQFIQQLAQKLSIQAHIIERSGDDCSRAHSEESLRTFRYESLIRVAHRIGARYIVTGHTKDDQVETILFRILRGTGLSGLKGIPRIRVTEDVTILRPLLNTSRAEVIQFLNEIGQDYITDESNLQDNYSRNFLRLNVLPLIESRFSSQAFDSIARLGEQASNWDELIQSYTPKIEWVTRNNDCPKIRILNLMNQPSVIIIEVMKNVWNELGFPQQQMTYEKWKSVADLVDGPEQAVIQLPGEVTIIRTSELLTFQPTKTARKRKAASK